MVSFDVLSHHRLSRSIFLGGVAERSDPNLAELVGCIEAGVIFGHVRAASPGSVVSHENCHPFKFGRLVFMHNGHVEGFDVVRRAMLGLLTDEAFLSIRGLTDSEHCLALLVSLLPDPTRTTPFAPEELATAVVATIHKVGRYAGPDVSTSHPVVSFAANRVFKTLRS